MPASSPSERLSLRPSLGVAAGLVLPVIPVAIVLFAIDLPPRVQWGSLFVALALALRLAWRDGLLATGGAPAGIEYRDRDLLIVRRDGRLVRGRLSPMTLVTRWLVLLEYQPGAWWRWPVCLPLCAWNCGPEAFRRLRRHLTLSRL